MDSEASAPDVEMVRAWQPLTFGGVAALAQASTGRLFLVGLVVAGVMALATTRTWYVAWVPVIEAAIKLLPDRSEIRNGQLVWPGRRPVRLADNSFLAIAVSPETSAGTAGSDVTVEFTGNGCTASSILGSVFIPYPDSSSATFERIALAAQWQAWRPHLVAGTFLALITSVWALWLAVGLSVAPLVRLYTAMLGRAAGFGACVRLVIAACMPGELLMALGVMLYGLRHISLAELLAVAALHVLAVTAYVLISPLWLPSRTAPGTPPARRRRARSNNPFAAPPSEGDD